jgi:PPK2 family polyphosphate:nucleotide phosphotransferase
MDIDSRIYQAPVRKKILLTKWATKGPQLYDSKKEYKELMDQQVRKLRELQQVLYASNSYSLLLIFQAMDAAGKDSTIKHVMSGVNPQGCQVISFKHPSAKELQHDFLWRSSQHLPERGQIGIFNRSYYEEVLIVRVHPAILAKQNVPEELANPKTIWKNRFEAIRHHELHLAQSGTKILKFFLHISREEQRKRFLKRIEDPTKNWKFSPSDIGERQHWNQYMKAYEECLSETTTAHAPWYIIPADDKPSARLLVSDAITRLLQDLKLKYPEMGPTHQQELQQIRTQLLQENQESS